MQQHQREFGQTSKLSESQIHKALEREWYKFSRVVISICDDYLPTHLSQPRKPQRRRKGEDGIRHESEVQDNPVDLKDRVRRTPQRTEDERCAWKTQEKDEMAGNWHVKTKRRRAVPQPGNRNDNHPERLCCSEEEPRHDVARGAFRVIRLSSSET